MAEYHVGCGITAIWAGTLNKKGDRWLHKSVVTDEAFEAVALYCLEHNEAMNFDYEGKRFRLEVTDMNVGKCKDCKWWKDSDGIYRRGGHTESQCPINRKEVLEGNGYCYMFEPQESEVRR